MQCYNKYHGALSSGGAASDPLSSGATAKSRREWTASEDRELLKAYKAHGNAWSKIALVVQRPSRQVLGRCHTTGSAVLLSRLSVSVFSGGRF
jgi:hypothetical protein